MIPSIQSPPQLSCQRKLASSIPSISLDASFRWHDTQPSPSRLTALNIYRAKTHSWKKIQHNEDLHKKNDYDALLQILHEAIAAKQIYPENALALNQTGKVRFGFFLYPDGHLSHISLLQSSGILSIDEAAKSAIFAASPIKETIAYLKSKTYFTVDVVFA